MAKTHNYIPFLQRKATLSSAISLQGNTLSPAPFQPPIPGLLFLHQDPDQPQIMLSS